MERCKTSVKTAQDSEQGLEQVTEVAQAGGMKVTYLTGKPEPDTDIPEHDAQITSGKDEKAMDFDHQGAAGGVSQPEVEIRSRELGDFLRDEIKGEYDDNENLPQLEPATLERQPAQEPGKEETSQVTNRDKDLTGERSKEEISLVTSQAGVKLTGEPDKMEQDASLEQHTGDLAEYQSEETSLKDAETGEPDKMDQETSLQQESGEAVCQVPEKLDSSDSSTTKETGPEGEEPKKVEPVAPSLHVMQSRDSYACFSLFCFYFHLMIIQPKHSS